MCTFPLSVAGVIRPGLWMLVMVYMELVAGEWKESGSVVLQYCHPSLFTVTTTTVIHTKETVTAVNCHFNIQTFHVTSTTVLTTATFLTTQMMTVVAQPVTLTTKHYFTQPVYRQVTKSVDFTVLVTDTYHIVATEVSISEQTVTKTMTELQTVTETNAKVVHKTEKVEKLCQVLHTYTEFITPVQHTVTQTQYTTISVVSTVQVMRPNDQIIQTTQVVLDKKTLQCSGTPSLTNHKYLENFISWAADVVGMDKLKDKFRTEVNKHFFKGLTEKAFKEFVKKNGGRVADIEHFDFQVGVKLPIKRP